MVSEMISSWMYAGIRYLVATAASAPHRLMVVATDAHGGERRVVWTEPPGQLPHDIAWDWNKLPALERTRRAEQLLGKVEGQLTTAVA